MAGAFREEANADKIYNPYQHWATKQSELQ
jgi:hypothetical protein